MHRLVAVAEPDIHLASQSPRRRALLAQIGMRHDVVGWRWTKARSRRGPREYVLRLALAKARAGRALRPDRPVLGADTAVVVDDQILGKPLDRADGIAMLARLSGREHRVLTGWPWSATARKADCRSARAFPADRRGGGPKPTGATGEPVDKAGGYAVQGLAAALHRVDRGQYFRRHGAAAVRKPAEAPAPGAGIAPLRRGEPATSEGRA